MITPLGILAVNASAFVMVHLNEFRVGIAACAVVSGLVLNGLTAWWLLRMVSRNAPPLYREIGVVLRRDKPRTPVLEAFLSTLKPRRGAARR